jgi:hypothetical protein
MIDCAMTNDTLVTTIMTQDDIIIATYAERLREGHATRKRLCALYCHTATRE